MKQFKLDIEILNWQVLKGIPSASGIVKYNEDFFVIGDDSPYLFHIDPKFNLLSKKLIHSSGKLEGNIIPKFHKPDFEAMEMVSDTQILIFGSGSKSPERDVCVFVDIEKETTFKQIDISLFYN